MIALLLLFLLTSCSMSEVLETPTPRTKSDTIYTPRAVDTLKLSDRPIGFEVSVDEWEDEDIDINL
jgi:hypothetical protein